MLLLATATGSSQGVIGSLLLEQTSEFAARASSLRLACADPAQDEEVARQLLWYASREMAVLRCGGALLAQPAAADDRPELESFGFASVSTDSDESLMALVTRKDPSELAGASHATLRVSAMQQSLDFWSLLHYTPTRVFTTNGARAAWLNAPWTPLAIEVIEVPELILRQTAPSKLAPSTEALGPAHLCLDVTALGISLPSTIEVLQQRSMGRFGRPLRVLLPPHQQMMGDLVAEVRTRGCIVTAESWTPAIQLPTTASHVSPVLPPLSHPEVTPRLRVLCRRLSCERQMRCSFG